MQTLLWPDEIREPAFASLDDVGEASPKELKMAELLLETLAGDYDPDDFEDDYAVALNELVERKLEGGEVTAVKEEKPSSGEVVDLLAALQKSVAAAKSARGEESDEETDQGADAAQGEKPARKTAKKSSAKAPAKKSAAKKSASKKSATKKSAAKKKAS